MADAPTGAGLRRDAIGFREVLFQSITHMAPAAAVAFSIVVGAQFAAGALPLSVVFALVGCLLVAISIGQLAKHLPSAGGFATYASQGLHPTVGFMVAWGYAMAEALVAPLLYLIFGNVVASTLATEYGWSFDTWWPIAAVGAALIVFLLGWFGVRVGAVAGTLLGLFEILVFATLAVWLIVKAGDANTLSVFGTEFATAPGFDGFSGIVAGSVYCILAFIGFEAAAPLAEEARNPRRTVQIAVVAAAALIGIFTSSPRMRRTSTSVRTGSWASPHMGTGIPGNSWVATSGTGAGSWCSSPSSTRRSPTRTQARSPRRERGTRSAVTES